MRLVVVHGSAAARAVSRTRRIVGSCILEGRTWVRQSSVRCRWKHDEGGRDVKYTGPLME